MRNDRIRAAQSGASVKGDYVGEGKVVGSLRVPGKKKGPRCGCSRNVLFDEFLWMPVKVPGENDDQISEQDKWGNIAENLERRHKSL